MSALRKQIVDAVVAALNTSTPSGVPAAETARVLGLDLSTLPRIIVYRIREEELDVGGRRGPLQKARLELAVECWAAGDESTPADEATEPLTTWAFQALTDQALGGLVNNCRPVEINYGLGTGEVDFCLATVSFMVEYSFRTGDPEVRT